jgi:hypothetical protein
VGKVSCWRNAAAKESRSAGGGRECHISVPSSSKLADVARAVTLLGSSCGTSLLFGRIATPTSTAVHV